ncbi:hypothetical protein LOD99_10983 [Oopsacas minuta]|uniref:Uncharacterized protein n=1 Tax=Oopsacas minuta TaxID=111878 RepID=A0AAV7KCU3_9METZ|nr:hypothetical protein LOD99_10983 [Oopsacas minuta]
MIFSWIDCKEPAYTYEVYKKTVINELINLKDTVIDHIKNRTYLSELYKKLATTDGKSMMHTQSVLVFVLKDCSPSEIVRKYVFSILEVFINNALLVATRDSLYFNSMDRNRFLPYGVTTLIKSYRVCATCNLRYDYRIS